MSASAAIFLSIIKHAHPLSRLRADLSKWPLMGCYPHADMLQDGHLTIEYGRILREARVIQTCLTK